METILLKTKQFSVNEKQLIGLLYSCPIGEPSPKCALSQTRELIKSNYFKIIDELKNDKISEILSEHKKCLIKRTMGNDIEKATKNLHRFYKEIAYLHWTTKGILDILTAELKKRQWIKSRRNFAKLFDNKDKNIKVYWNKQYKYELVYLLFRLKEEGYINTVNSKGYFRIAEQQIMDYSNNVFKINSLKKISSKITKNPHQYIEIIEEVEDIMFAISSYQNGLL